MATVVLQYAGAALGTLVGGPVGGMLGRAIGGLAGNVIDQRVFGSNGKRNVEGPRLSDLRVMASEEGAAIPTLWGRMRIAGQVIWATNLEEVVSTSTQKQSSKGGGGGSSATTTTTTYSYYGNFAVGLCEGEIDGIGRVWADGKNIDIEGYTTRLYTGTETQLPDSLISTIEGVGLAPAYRGLAYIVFEKLPLGSFGNRLPQLSFEVFRRGSSVGDRIRAVNIIPGSTEFGYDTALVTRNEALGATTSENAHASADRSDWSVSIDQLQATCRNLQSVSLVTAWFGNDLRLGHCSISPRVDNAAKVTNGAQWVVSGQLRSAVASASSFNGAPAYGGTPSDESIVRAIQDLRTRGLGVTFYPFVLMDIPNGNTLPDPYGGTAQAAYPWRGRMTASLAPGQPGTPDKTAAINTQVNAFMGTALPSHFTNAGGTIAYSGPAQWSYRRMILHYAKLCALAGGVDAFLIGSELRGLTTLRGAANSYPFVAALRTLAADVKSILPSAKISYAADWSEYFGHQPGDGSNDVLFHLDALWADSNIDFIGIDNYMPLTDWRDGQNHLDLLAGFGSITERNYLQSRITGGEGYDWYYANAAARAAQSRTAIADGAYGKPWVFRYKDLVNWWSNTHRNRPGGVEAATTTSWLPQSKPIWFTECGCPAMDKASNQPNVFYDAKSSESALPYFSGGQRDDLIQNRFVQVVQSYWAAAGAHNPVSSVYGASMVRADRLAWWAWDARPFPTFPLRSDVWSDAANFAFGHWLNGRLGAVDLGELIATIAARFGFTSIDTSEVAGLVDGFVLDRPMSGRDALEALLQAFAIDAVESEGVLKFRPRATGVTTVITEDGIAEASRNRPSFSETRKQETELPRQLRLAYVESALDYRGSAVSQQQLGAASSRDIALQLPAAVPQALAQARVDVGLAEAWSQRTSAMFTLSPRWLSVEPGDSVQVNGKRFRVTAIIDGEARQVEAVAHDNSVYDVPALVERNGLAKLPPVYGKADVLMMDLALATTAQPAAPWIAAQANPWPGKLAALKQSGASSYVLNTVVGAQATMGQVLNALPAGIIGRVDFTSSLDVVMNYGALTSATLQEVLAGVNFAAIGTAATGFEIIQFQNAELIAADTYRLTGLLRAQAGSREEMLPLRGAGERFVLLNAAVTQPTQSVSEASVPSRWRLGPPTLDHGHPAYVQLDVPATLKALRPLRPARLSLKRNAAGFDVRWIRQTRTGGDAWELEDVPLGETLERYKLQVMNGAAVVRSTEVQTPDYFYADTNVLADFGGMPSTLTLRVSQFSSAVGFGPYLERTVNV
jgi:hypothetical protein